MISDTIKVGKLIIEVHGPYPCWCEFIYNNQRHFSIHHSELSDFRYAIEKAMQIAKLKLGKDSAEVDPKSP